jgi:hypothetical protein
MQYNRNTLDTDRAATGRPLSSFPINANAATAEGDLRLRLDPLHVFELIEVAVEGGNRMIELRRRRGEVSVCEVCAPMFSADQSVEHSRRLDCFDSTALQKGRALRAAPPAPRGFVPIRPHSWATPDPCHKISVN